MFRIYDTNILELRWIIFAIATFVAFCIKPYFSYIGYISSNYHLLRGTVLISFILFLIMELYRFLYTKFKFKILTQSRNENTQIILKVRPNFGAYSLLFVFVGYVLNLAIVIFKYNIDCSLLLKFSLFFYIICGIWMLVWYYPCFLLFTKDCLICVPNIINGKFLVLLYSEITSIDRFLGGFSIKFNNEKILETTGINIDFENKIISKDFLLKIK